MEREILLRSLKGAPLSCLIALSWLGPAGRNDLVASTGYGRDAISDALRVLVRLNLVTKVHYRQWEINEENTLFVDVLNVSKNGPNKELSTGYPQPDHEEPGRRNTRLSDLERRNTRLSALDSSSSYYVTIDKEILAVCKQAGIFGEMAESIASDPFVINRGPEFVLCHVWKAEEKEDKGLPLAIWRINKHWELSKRDLKEYRRRNDLRNDLEDIVVS